jgi:hypothetical protein
VYLETPEAQVMQGRRAIRGNNLPDWEILFPVGLEAMQGRRAMEEQGVAVAPAVAEAEEGLEAQVVPVVLGEEMGRRAFGALFPTARLHRQHLAGLVAEGPEQQTMALRELIKYMRHKLLSPKPYMVVLPGAAVLHQTTVSHFRPQ